VKIAYASDLHFEFKTLKLNNVEPADVLILAGDILNVEKLQRSSLLHKDSHYRDVLSFFDYVTSNFKHVLMVMGNHEYYGSDIDQALVTLNELLSYDNFHILDGDYLVIDNMLFVGGTLWTDYNNEDPLTLLSSPRIINDYRAIYTNNNKIRVTVSDILQKHKHFVKWVENIDKSGYDKNILITHHSPSFQTTADHYKHETVMNGLFSSDLDYLLTNFDYAFFGHQHDPKEPIVNDCMLLNNARGYPFESMHHDFKLKYITI
jgi:predicted phosphodiesterase